MGVYYDGVGGIGVKITDDIIACLVENKTFSEEDWEDDPDECLEYIGIAYNRAGNSYTDDTYYYYWFVDGNTLGAINANADEFIEKLKAIEINIDAKDLSVIEDLHVW